MNNNINWAGNRVLDQTTARQAPPSSAPAQQSRVPSASAQNSTTQQGGTAPPATLQGPPPSSERGYIPYFLASNIGKTVRADFIIGTNQYIDKTGVITEVGINYFVLYDVNSRSNIMCDLYSVKFVTVAQP